jgi:hypothetical protein
MSSHLTFERKPQTRRPGDRSRALWFIPSITRQSFRDGNENDYAAGRRPKLGPPRASSPPCMCQDNRPRTDNDSPSERAATRPRLESSTVKASTNPRTDSTSAGSSSVRLSTNPRPSINPRRARTTSPLFKILILPRVGSQHRLHSTSLTSKPFQPNKPVSWLRNVSRPAFS